MVAFNKFDQFTEDLGSGVHDLSSDTLKIALSNTAPNASDETLSDITQISAGNGYVAGGNTVTTTSYTQTSGVGKLILVDNVFTASGGAIATFRYVILYNDTPTSPADPLIGYYDNGSAVDLANGETFTVDFDGSAGALTVT